MWFFFHAVGRLGMTTPFPNSTPRHGLSLVNSTYIASSSSIPSQILIAVGALHQTLIPFSIAKPGSLLLCLVSVFLMIQMRSSLHVSVLQNCRCRMQLINRNPIAEPISYANYWFSNFHGIGRRLGRLSVNSIISSTSKQSGLKRLSGQHIIKSDVYTRNFSIQGGAEVDKREATKYYDVQNETEGREYIKRDATIIVFDLETTGLRREVDRIIEIGLQDLNGGENSTFQTLIKPECYVSNSQIHGITNEMLNQSNVPRFVELIPILKHYVKSRQSQGKPILWVAHNARSFDVPFLVHEFTRCNEEIPPEWLFLDTLAREMAKLEGTQNLMGKSLAALREYYNIPLQGEAHRAMSDVHSLTRILQELTKDLKLSVPDLVERSFTALDIGNTKKKKSTS